MIKFRKMIVCLAAISMMAMSFTGTALADERSFDESFYNYELVDGIYKVNDTHFVLFPEHVSVSGEPNPAFAYSCVKASSKYGSAGDVLNTQADWKIGTMGYGCGVGYVLSTTYQGWVRAKLYDYEDFTNKVYVSGRWKSGSSTSVMQGEQMIHY